MLSGSLMAALCGVTITLGWSQKRELSGSGSVSNTSSEAAMSVPSSSARRMSSSTCSPPRPALTKTGPAEAPAAGEALEQGVVGDAVRLRRERQEKDEDVGAGEEGGALRLAGEDLEPRTVLGRAAPARDVEAHDGELAGGILPEDAEPHDADPDVARGRLVAVVLPHMRALLRVVAALLAQVHQAVQDDIFAHAVGEVVVDDTRDRHVRQVGIAHQVVDAGAEGEDRLQVRQAAKGAGRVLPGHGIGNRRGVVGIAEAHDAPAGQQPLQPLDPGIDVPAREGDENGHATRSAMRSRMMPRPAGLSCPIT